MSDLIRNPIRYISKFANVIRQDLEKSLSFEEVTGSQARVLAFLSIQEKDVFQKDVEEEFNIRPASATVLLQMMEKKGLIRRVPTENDRRYKKIEVTGKTLAHSKETVREIERLTDVITEGITQEELEVFYRVIERMFENQKNLR